METSRTCNQSSELGLSYHALGPQTGLTSLGREPLPEPDESDDEMNGDGRLLTNVPSVQFGS